MRSRPLPGRSLLPLLETEKADGWDEVYGSHQFHEVTMYYPMRMVRTRTHKYILNLAHQLPYPQAADILASPTWKAIAARRPAKMGSVDVAAYFQRPAEELYDIERDPHETQNIAGSPAAASILTDLRQRVNAFRERTRDPWFRAGAAHSAAH
jgi:N-sulfoglucosamine sulfohydrolase